MKPSPFLASGILLIIKVTVNCSLTYGQAKGFQAPSFYNTDEILSFPEILAEPPSDIYGSSIHVWCYRDKNEKIREVAVTGHAESRTCHKISALLFNTYCQKPPFSGDFLAAGAARFVNPIDSSRVEILKLKEEIRNYKDTKEKRAFNKFMLTLTDYNDPDWKKLKTKIDSLEERMRLQRLDPLVAEYARLSEDDEAISDFIKETASIAEESGLVKRHSIPYELIGAVKQRINANLTIRTRQTLSFDDLLDEYGVPEAVIWLEMQRLSDKMPLEIKLPSDVLSRESFVKAKQENRDQLLIAMVGDIQRRLSFFIKQKNEAEIELKRLRYVSDSELAEIITLDICIDFEIGTKQKCPKGEEIKMTRREYRDSHLPDLIKSYKKEIDRLINLRNEIEQDRSGGNSCIDELNHMTLIDAMLRNWDLPVGRSQDAFLAWRKQEREPIWQMIFDKMRKIQIDPAVLSGSNVIFNVFYQDDSLVIKPYLVLDLQRSIVVLDPKNNASIVKNAWDYREVVAWKTGEKQDSAAAFACLKQIESIDTTGWHELAEKETITDIQALAQNAVSTVYGDWKISFSELTNSIKSTYIFQRLYEERYNHYKNESLQLIRDQLFNLLNYYPEQFWRWLEHYFRQYSVQALNVSRQAQEEALTLLDPEAILKCIPSEEKLFNSRELPLEYINQYRLCLESTPAIPVDFHFQFARILAILSSKGAKYGAWEILIGSQRRDPAIVRRLEALSIAWAIDFDLSTEIKKRMDIIHLRDSIYYSSLVNAKGEYTQSSTELINLPDTYSKTWSLMALCGAYYYLDLAKLKSRAHAMDASFCLWQKKEKSLDIVLQHLNNATKDEMMSVDSFFVFVRDRIEYLKKFKIKPDQLAVVELSGLLMSGCDNNLKSVIRSEMPPVLSGHKDLVGRAWFEAGSYNRAFETIFSEATPIMNYSAGIKWQQLPEDTAAQPDTLIFNWNNNTLFCHAKFSGKNYKLLKLDGLTTSQGLELKEYLEKLPAGYWSSKGRLSHQILFTTVPQCREIRLLVEVMSDPELRLALLKTMAYRRIFPAEDMVSPNGFDLREDKDRKYNDRYPVDKVKTVKVPNLKELKDLLAKE